MYPISLLEPTCSLIFNANDTSACLVASLFDDGQADANDKHTHIHTQTESVHQCNCKVNQAVIQLQEENVRWGGGGERRRESGPASQRESLVLAYFSICLISLICQKVIKALTFFYWCLMQATLHELIVNASATFAGIHPPHRVNCYLISLSS